MKAGMVSSKTASGLDFENKKCGLRLVFDALAYSHL